MSLQDELLELNAVYQSVQEKNEALRQENEDLRALVSDYEKMISGIINVIGAVIVPLEGLQQRARVLLREEQQS